MDELVKRLSTGTHPIETIRPDKTLASLKECIERNYVHIMFTETGTELGTELDLPNCDLTGIDSGKASGTVHLEGALTLNYDRVRVVADIDLATLEGQGCLKSISDEEYDSIIKNKP